MPCKPLKLSLEKHPTLKTCFLLALASDKKVRELHGPSFHVRHLQGWKFCMFSLVLEFVAKNQNPLIHDPRFEEFSIPSLDDFVGGNKRQVCCFSSVLSGSTCLLQSSTILKSHLFVLATKGKKRVSQNTI